MQVNAVSPGYQPTVSSGSVDAKPPTQASTQQSQPAQTDTVTISAAAKAKLIDDGGAVAPLDTGIEPPPPPPPPPDEKNPRPTPGI